MLERGRAQPDREVSRQVPTSGAARRGAPAAAGRRAGAGVEWNDTTDIIAGSAGVGLFLLYAADASSTCPRPARSPRAPAAGCSSAAAAMQAGASGRWTATSALLLPNFSHGTAGVAYFLATLHQATKDRAFLDGALAGARLPEGPSAKTEGDVCLVFHHEPDEAGLASTTSGGATAPPAPRGSGIGCGRPPGIARGWSGRRKSARGIVASGVPDRPTPGFWNNVGQCCGSAGVAEFFLAHHRATGDAASLAFARRVSAQILASATRDASGIRWPHAEHRTRPAEIVAQTGWMQGAPGIGAWFLHLDAFERGAAPPIRFPDSPF